MDKHDLIVKLKDLALELGRTPTHIEFITKVPRTKYATQKLFGTHAVLVQAAGLDAVVRGAKKQIGNEIFEKDIEKHLTEAKVITAPNINEPHPLAAIISDIHWPFVNQKVVDRFYEYVGDERPDWVIINGDAWDMYSHTKFPRSHNIFTPREEQSKAREQNETFWKEIKARAPSAKCVQMLGNHDLRPMKRILEEYPEAEDWIAEKLKQLFSFAGVQTIFDAREELFLNSTTAVFHGYKTKLGDHRDYTLLNSINGHSHVGGVVFRKVRGSVIYELNSGFAGDPEGKGLTYTPQKITPWTPGFAAINKYGPMFIAV